ncbi:MAG TPA: NADH-quinone oxidoreductase subunit C [Candidatus Bathyarchaeia archaeon]|nr:NADH-quinone oxidoreductase subunit C [Candidatus Bathyarchaeia archaeon]
MNQEITREETIINKTKSNFPDFVKDAKIDRHLRVTITFDKDHLLEIAKWMREELGLDHLKGVAGIDFPTHKKLEVLYFLGSFSKPELQNLIVTLKAELPRDNPSIASAVSIWQSAHFHERETFEMFGVKFEGHPDLRKLLTLDNWEGPPPMLKDIKFPEIGQR